MRNLWEMVGDRGIPKGTGGRGGGTEELQLNRLGGMEENRWGNWQGTLESHIHSRACSPRDSNSSLQPAFLKMEYCTTALAWMVDVLAQSDIAKGRKAPPLRKKGELPKFPEVLV